MNAGFYRPTASELLKEREQIKAEMKDGYLSEHAEQWNRSRLKSIERQIARR